MSIVSLYFQLRAGEWESDENKAAVPCNCISTFPLDNSVSSITKRSNVSHARWYFFNEKFFKEKLGWKYHGGRRVFFFSREEAHRRLIALVPQAKACIQGFSEAFLAEIVIRDLRGRSGRIFTVSRWLLSEFVNRSRHPPPLPAKEGTRALFTGGNQLVKSAPLLVLIPTEIFLITNVFS